MIIKMTDTRRGTADGHGVRQYQKGVTYDIPFTIGAYFISNGYAQEVRDEEYTSVRSRY